MTGAARRPRAWPASAHIALFGMIIALPLLALLGSLLWRSSMQEHRRLERMINQELDELTASIDRDIERRKAVLQTLATAPAVAAQDWESFYAQAKASLGPNYLVVIDEDGRQLVNTYQPYGQQPPRTGNPAINRVMKETKQPVVSALFISLVTKAYVYSVSIPILRDDKVVYALGLALYPEDLLALMQDQKMDPGWTTTVWDQNGVIMARSRDHAQWVGRPVPERLRVRPPGQVVEEVGLNGQDVMAVSKRLPHGWTVRVSFPARQIEAQIRSALWTWAIAVLAVVALTAVAGYLFGRAFTKPLARAAEAAAALGRGERFVLPDGPVTEVNAMGHALTEAQRELEASRLALRYSEQLLGTAADVAQFGAHQYDAVHDRVYRSAQIRRILGVEEDEGHDLESAFDFVHPDDREMVRTRKHQVLEREDQYQLTYRIRRPDGEVRWVMDRGQVERGTDGKALRVIGVLVDITDLKASEDRQRLLFDELNHRVKNTLAIVQSLALQTLRSTPQPEAFSRAFGERLQSLSRAHDLLTQSAWEGAPLGKLIAAVLEPFNAEASGGRVAMRGEPVVLPANVTITLALMLNELATNAAKYGALSGSTGRVSIAWIVRAIGEGQTIELQWREEGGPPTVPPQRRGFGSRLLAASAQQIQGEFTMDFLPAGLTCRLRFTVPRSLVHGPVLARNAGV